MKACAGTVDDLPTSYAVSAGLQGWYLAHPGRPGVAACEPVLDGEWCRENVDLSALAIWNVALKAIRRRGAGT